MEFHYQASKLMTLSWFDYFSLWLIVSDIWQWILHDWSDEECVKILKKCKEALPSNGKGKVIIIEIVLNDNKEDDNDLADAKLYFDFLMMVLLTGRERSEKDWKNLFLNAGFSHYKITPMFGLRSLIEVFP